MYQAKIKEFIEKNCPYAKDEDMVKLIKDSFNIDMSLHAFRKLRRRMGIKKGHGRGRNLIKEFPKRNV